MEISRKGGKESEKWVRKAKNAFRTHFSVHSSSIRMGQQGNVYLEGLAGWLIYEKWGLTMFMAIFLFFPHFI
jgi:hypothetical protein